MKQIALGVLCAVILSSCGGKSGTEGKDNANKNAGISTDVYRGKMLVSQNDCLTCHQEDNTLVGPSYKSIAQKYAGQPNITDTLAAKIIKGGSGVWGETAMTPHPNLSPEDAKLLATYVMSLGE